MKKILLILGTFSLLFSVGAGCKKTDTNREDVIIPTGFSPELIMESQALQEDLVRIAKAVSALPAWIVIYADDGGKPGKILGQAHIAPGVYEDIVARIDTTQTTKRLFAILHTDTGEENTFDFPENDQPITGQNGKVITAPFMILDAQIKADEEEKSE